MRNKLLLVLALVAVFAAGFATRAIVSSLCGGSCGRHAQMACCHKDGSCDRHGKQEGKLDSTNISLPGTGTEGEGKACCKKENHAAAAVEKAEVGACCKKTEQGDPQVCCGKHAAGDLQACCKKT
jgi:hypothetical protein